MEKTTEEVFLALGAAKAPTLDSVIAAAREACDAFERKRKEGAYLAKRAAKHAKKKPSSQQRRGEAARRQHELNFQAAMRAALLATTLSP